MKKDDATIRRYEANVVMFLIIFFVSVAVLGASYQFGKFAGVARCLEILHTP